jgi:Outer membrane protein beta-barrel domain
MTWKTSSTAAAAVAAMAFAAAPVTAQSSALPGSDVFTITLFGGGFSPVSDLGAGEFDTGGTVGGTVGVWFGPYVGVRANVLWGSTDVSGAVPQTLVGESPNAWLYNGDLLVRYPWTTRSGAVFVYAVGGLGAKTYDFDRLDSETDFAGNVGLGGEYRFTTGRWGIMAEVRDFISTFDAFGVDTTQNDLVWTAGISLNF